MPSDASKQVAKAAIRAFGGKPQITRYWDDDRVNHVDILACEGRPQNGTTSLGTIGLSEWPLFDGDQEYGTRVEFVGAIGAAFRGFDNALATAAFCIMNSKWFCYPGAIFPDVLAMYDCSPTMRHFLFVPPFLWENDLKPLKFGGMSVAWLLAVPISDEERAFAEANGSDRLEELFVDRGIDIFNLHRESEA